MPLTKDGFILDDTALYLSLFSDICSRCIHFEQESVLGKRKTCKAFPYGIPGEIWLGEIDHTKPYVGDNGITFQPIPEAKQDSKRAVCKKGKSCGDYCISKDKKCASEKTISHSQKGNQNYSVSSALDGIMGEKDPAPEIVSKGSPASTLFDVENKIKDLNFETGIAIDPKTGKVLMSKGGESAKVGFTNEELKECKGAIFTHNHPDFNRPPSDPIWGGSTFSVDDLSFACTAEVKEMRAVGHLDAYSLKPPASGWNKEFFDNSVLPSYKKHINQAMDEFRPKVARGEIDTWNATLKTLEKTYVNVCKDTGMTITKKPIRGVNRRELEKKYWDKQAAIQAHQQKENFRKSLLALAGYGLMAAGLVYATNKSDAMENTVLQNTPTDSSNVKTFIDRLIKILNKGYIDKLDQLLDVWIDPGLVISGVFRDGQKYIKFSVEEKDLNFKEIDKPTKKLDSLNSYSIRYDAPTKKRCKKGTICKGTCIAKGKICRTELISISSPAELSQLRKSAVDFQLATKEKLTPPPKPVEVPPPKEDFKVNPQTGEEYTIRELKTKASEQGIYKYSRLSKEELRESLVATQNNSSEAARERLSITFGKDRSTGAKAIQASGVRGPEKRKAQEANRTWRNLNTLARFAGSQPAGWGAAATGAFLLGLTIRNYERLKTDYRAGFKENAEQAQEKAATLGAANNGAIGRSGNKKNITFVISADKGDETSKSIVEKLKKIGAEAEPGDADDFFHEDRHHYVPFGLKESGAIPGASDRENALNTLTDYVSNFRRKKDQDAIDLAANIYAYGIQRTSSTKRQSEIDKLQSSHTTLLKNQPKVLEKVEALKTGLNKVSEEVTELEKSTGSATDPIKKKKLTQNLTKKRIEKALSANKYIAAEDELERIKKSAKANRVEYAKILSRPETGKRELANKGKNINIITHSRSGQTAKTALEYLARMQLPGEPSGKEILEQTNLVMFGTPHFGFTENVSKRQRTVISSHDPVAALPVWGDGSRQEWVSSVKGHYIDDYIGDKRTREVMREMFGYYDDSLLERQRKLKKDAYDAALRFDKKPVCKTGKPCKSKSGSIVCIPKKNKCASDLTPAAVGKIANENKLLTGLAIAGISGAVVATSLVGAAALVKHDLKKSEIPFDSIPPVPEGDPESWTDVKERYNQLKPGDLIRKNIKGGNLGNRQHYAVYIGKDPMADPNSIYSHLLIDTGVNWKSRDNEPYVRCHGLAWFGADMNPKDNSIYEKVPEKDMGLTEGTQKFTGEEIVERANKMLYQKFTYKGFDSNCEAFARAIVEGKGYSIQGQKNSPLTNFVSGAVTNKILEIRSSPTLESKKQEIDRLEKSGQKDTPEYQKAKEAYEGEINNIKTFSKDREVPLLVIGKYEILGYSSYAKDKYKMNAQQIADYLDKEKALAERRQWEKVENPYSKQVEEGYLGKMSRYQEQQKEQQDRSKFFKEFEEKRAAERYKPFNAIVSFVRKGRRKDADIPDEFYSQLGLPNPEEFSKQLDIVANKYPGLSNNIKVDGIKNYLLILYATLNQDLDSTTYQKAKADAFSFRFDKKVECEKGKPCKTKSGGIVCIPKKNKCAADESKEGDKKLVIAAISGAAIAAALLTAKEIIEKTSVDDVSKKDLSLLSQDQADKISIGKPVGDQGKTSKVYFANNEKGDKFVLKQMAPLLYHQAASEVVVSDMAIKSGIPVNKSQLVPASVSMKKKGLGTTATLHSMVSGDDARKIQAEGLFSGLSMSQGSWQAVKGLDADGIRTISQHPDLAKIAALDTFVGNWDRNPGNYLYDKSKDSFTGIDLGNSYNRIFTNSPSLAGETRKNLAKIDVESLSDKERTALTSYTATLRDLYEKNPPDETIKRHAKYLKLSGGNMDVFRKYISAHQIFDDHRQTGMLVYDLEKKLKNKPSNSVQKVKTDAFNIRIDKKVECEKGKPCKTEKGGIVCIPKKNKCASDKPKEQDKKTLGIAAGSLVAGVLVGGLAVKALGEKQGSNLIQKFIKEQGFDIKEHPMKLYLRSRKEYRDNFPVSADKAEEMSASVKTEKLPEHIKSVNFTVSGFYGYGFGRAGVEKSEGYFASKVSDLLGKDHHVVRHENKEFTLEDTGNKSWDDSTALQYAKNVFVLKHNPEAVKLASEVIAWRKANPDKQINLIGHSAGGIINHEAAQILALKKIPVKVVNMGSPWYGMTEKVGESYTIVDEGDGLFQGKEGAVARDEVKVKTKNPSVKDQHSLKHYLSSEDTRDKIKELIEDKAKMDSSLQYKYSQAYQQALAFRSDKACGKSFIPNNAICRANGSNPVQKQVKRPPKRLNRKGNGQLGTALAAGAGLALAGAVGGGLAANAVNKNERDKSDLDRRTARVEKILAEQALEKAAQKEKEASEKLGQFEKHTEELNRVTIGKSARRIATTALTAALPGAIMGAAGGPQGALLSAGASAGLAAAKTATEEGQKLLGSVKGVKGRAAQAALASTTPLIHSKAGDIEQSAQKLIEEKKEARKRLRAAAGSSSLATSPGGAIQ